jgi:hypothetical protein
LPLEEQVVVEPAVFHSRVLVLDHLQLAQVSVVAEVVLVITPLQAEMVVVGL